MPNHPLLDAFTTELKDMLNAERQLVKALPTMVENASSNELRRALQNHLEETEGQIERVEAVFQDLDTAPRGKSCEAMKGLIREANEAMKQEVEPAVKDAMIIAQAQKVEHYEIATYGTLCTWARALGYDHALQLLKQNIDQEKAADEKLSALAESINRAALSV